MFRARLFIANFQGQGMFLDFHSQNSISNFQFYGSLLWVVSSDLDLFFMPVSLLSRGTDDLLYYTLYVLVFMLCFHLCIYFCFS